MQPVPDLTARQLHAVLVVAEYNSFIAAAAFLKTSQPSLTRTIMRVEDVLGVRLFDSSTRRVAITAAGKEFVAVAERMLNDLRISVRSMREVGDEQRGQIIISSIMSVANGLIPAIIQDQNTKRVLMMAWMNRASLEKTLETGKTHFWSRSRQKFWMKGESSGHTQTVKDVSFDCDGDTLLIQVEQIGAACHEGYQSCFFRSVQDRSSDFKITEPQLLQPDQIYPKK